MGALDAISFEARRVLLEVLMGVAWADRVLVEEERHAAQAAATGLGLVLPPEQDLTSADRRPIPPEAIDPSRLGTRDREIIYLCAAWMALADEVEDPAETRILERLRTRFGLGEERSAWLRRRAEALRAEQAPDASWWRAFDRLVVGAARALEAGPA